MSLPPGKNLLAEHLNPVYVETGIWRSDSLAMAMEAGFQKIYGIEINPEFIQFARDRFDLQNFPLPGLQLIQGDSAECLWDAIKGIAQPITFFLDSHFSLLAHELPGKNPFPLIQELQQIRLHSFKRHTIIIDDFLYMTHPDVTGWCKDQIEGIIKSINPDYEITYEANPVVKNLLVAKPCPIEKQGLYGYDAIEGRAVYKHSDRLQ